MIDGVSTANGNSATQKMLEILETNREALITGTREQLATVAIQIHERLKIEQNSTQAVGIIANYMPLENGEYQVNILSIGDCKAMVYKTENLDTINTIDTPKTSDPNGQVRQESTVTKVFGSKKGHFPEDPLLRVQTIKVKKGDVLLLTTDGIWESVSERKIQTIVSDYVDEPEANKKISREIMEAALDEDSKNDDKTIVTICF